MIDEFYIEVLDYCSFSSSSYQLQLLEFLELFLLTFSVNHS